MHANAHTLAYILCLLEPAECCPQDLQTLLRLNLSHIEPTSSGPAEILPHLFLGSRDDAVNVKALHKLGITHVLLGLYGWWVLLFTGHWQTI